MADQPTVTLNTGAAIPQLGFGVFQVPNEQVTAAVLAAIEAGYRSIDTAAMYRNEEGVGKAIAQSGIAREELFITTKLNNNAHGTDAARRAFDTSLAALGLDYLDLYLIHWPLPAKDLYVQTWQALEKIHSEGLSRAIGVSNFTIANLQRLADETEVVPALNQVELHPYLTQEPLSAYHAEHGILTESWSPLAKGGELLTDPVITSLADKYARTPAQIVIRWHLQLSYVVIPKSVTPSRITENFDVFDFELAEDDLTSIGELNRDERTGPDPDTFNP
jgi:2,5-diketo-D-gluconate reductase A